MSLEEDLHQLVLGMDGVATVYAADPLWLTMLKQVGGLLGQGDDAAPVPFVVCSEDGAGDGAGDGAEDGTHDGIVTVRVRIGTDGAQPAPAVARNVAEGIRAHVSLQRPGTLVRAVVEVSAIGL
ncbi:hypothetical protein AAGW05_12540 [Arthrobacter sp. LAPM80]|uniref:hypothetical protein n=1 Tax=Arthrobacter sp. LAPM80 TaxID=3141788 RepID=UPI00398ADB7D